MLTPPNRKNLSKHAVMKGNLVSLRALEPEDIDLMYRWENDHEVWKVSNTIAPFSKYVLRRYLQTAHLSIYETGQQRFIIERNGEGRPIGTVDLFDFDPFNLRAGIGILIYNKADRGRGCASEAIDLVIRYGFEYLHLHQLYCNVLSDNQLSYNMFRNKGFAEAGLKRDWIRNCEGWHDEILMQLIPPSPEEGCR